MDLAVVTDQSSPSPDAPRIDKVMALFVGFQPGLGVGVVGALQKLQGRKEKVKAYRGVADGFPRRGSGRGREPTAALHTS